MNWTLNQKSTLPLYQQIMLLIEEKVKAGELSPGTRLPSERKLAETLGVNRSTVIRSLEELAVQGLLIRKTGSGTYVNPDKWGLQTKPVINWGSPLIEEPRGTHSPYEQAAQALLESQKTKVIDLSKGILPPDLLPELHSPDLSWKELVDQEKEQATSHTGISSLKQSVQAFLQETYQMEVPLDEIMITSGTQNALFLISQGLLKPGDAVGIEAPSYFYSLRLFQAAGLRIVPIPMDAEGMTVKGLQEASLKHPLKMIFLNPVFQNPTGLVMSTRRKQEILDYCLMKRIPIVEDDAYGGLSFDDSLDTRPLKMIDQNQQVIYLGTLSKLAGRHLRIGWMIGPQPVLENLADIRVQIDSDLSFLPQFMADHFLRTEIKSYQKQVRTILKKRARRLEAWLKELYGEHIAFQEALGGFHLYCRFPDKSAEEVDTLLSELLDKHVVVAPGERFGDQSHGFRLSFVNFRTSDYLLTRDIKSS